jgi:hypothetical protein
LKKKRKNPLFFSKRNKNFVKRKGMERESFGGNAQEYSMWWT